MNYIFQSRIYQVGIEWFIELQTISDQTGSFPKLDSVKALSLVIL